MGAFLITLRETFEASLIIGLMLAFLKKTGALESHGRAVWQGTAAAILVSAIAATVLFAAFGKLEGTAQKLFEAITMLIAAGVLTGMVVTIEPGIYVAGEWGLRIEDLLVVTADGSESLSGLPKERQLVS